MSNPSADEKRPMAELTREQIEEWRSLIKRQNTAFNDEADILCDMALSRASGPPPREDQEELPRIISWWNSFLQNESGDVAIAADELRLLLTAASRSLAPEPILKGEVGEMVKQLRARLSPFEGEYLKNQRSRAADLLSRLSAARETVLEEAAQRCDERAEWAATHMFAPYSSACTDCANIIRTLKPSGSAESPTKQESSP